MKRLILAFGLALSLSACASLQSGWDTLTSTQVTVTTVAVAGNTFDALEATATGYLRLPRCNATNGPACRDAGVTKQVISAVRSGRVARNNLEQFFTDHPGKLGPQGLYDALQVAIATLQAVNNQYSIK